MRWIAILVLAALLGVLTLSLWSGATGELEAMWRGEPQSLPLE